MELTVQTLYGLLLRSKLFKPEDAKVMMARWNTESKAGATDLGKFTAWLVNRKYVTEYQASLLVRGHAEGFFVNTYKVLERLGKGRMGGVYKAEHETGQIVALKVLPPSKAREKNHLMRFHREAKIGMGLNHNNIVKTFETGKCNGLYYMIMEYLAGETLESFLKKSGKLSPAEACHIVYQALRGLDCINQANLVHRDLKPANMMLVGDVQSGSVLTKTLKILDMGLGKAAKPRDSQQQAATALHLTDEGVILGTPDYMAPEQARDARSIDIRADIYSLGCVLYHLLSGQPPFPDTNIVNQMIRHATEPPRPVQELNPKVPEGLNQIIQYMLAKEPKDRYQTPERCAQALAVFMNAGPFVAPANPDAEIKLQKYMTWLETEKTAVRDAKGGDEDGYLYDPPSEESVSTSDSNTDSSSETVVQRPGSQAGGSVGSFEFENVPAYKGRKRKEVEEGFDIGGWFTLSRRELTIFVVGVVAGTIATLLGGIFALNSRESKKATGQK